MFNDSCNASLNNNASESGDFMTLNEDHQNRVCQEEDDGEEKVTAWGYFTVERASECFAATAPPAKKIVEMA